MRIVTHNAKFHADDVFAVAALLILYPEAEIIRTRDEGLIKDADIVVDVGQVYDAENNRFDHHQVGGAGERENGIPYSSVGLVWKKFGEKISGSKSLMERIDRILIQSIDAGDNGVDLYNVLIPDTYPYLIQGVIDQYRLTWKESDDWDVRFRECVLWANGFLERMIKVESDIYEGESITRDAYAAAEDKRLIIIDRKYDLGRELVTNVLTALPEPVYAILYRHDSRNWQLVAIKKSHGSFKLRKALPVEWGAKQNSEFEIASGVTGVIFCHRNRFMCLANTKEAILELAQKALES